MEVFAVCHFQKLDGKLVQPLAFLQLPRRLSYFRGDVLSMDSKDGGKEITLGPT